MILLERDFRLLIEYFSGRLLTTHSEPDTSVHLYKSGSIAKPSDSRARILTLLKNS